MTVISKRTRFATCNTYMSTINFFHLRCGASNLTRKTKPRAARFTLYEKSALPEEEFIEHDMASWDWDWDNKDTSSRATSRREQASPCSTSR